MKHPKKTLACSAVFLLAVTFQALPGLASGQQEKVAEQAEVQAAPDHHRDFDFWLGDWRCETLDGQVAGKNTITAECNAMLLREEWRGVGGSKGTSINAYDQARGLWHQTWVDGQGGVLLLDGGLNEAGAMVLEGDRPSRTPGATVHHRVAWTPQEEGRVRQTWDVTDDGGTTWKVLADLIYIPN